MREKKQNTKTRNFELLFYLCFVAMSKAAVVHRQRSPEDLQQVLAWYKIRDTLLGRNSVQRDVEKALELASVCEHPNGIWLTQLFAGRSVKFWEEARDVFLGCCENDPRAICFSGLIGGSIHELCQAADLGDALAQARMSGRTSGEECLRWAEKSAAQGERDGFFQLGCRYRDGIGCEKDEERAKENFLIAAELRHVEAMTCFGSLLGETDPHRFVWLGRAAICGGSAFFLSQMEKQIRNFNSGTGKACVIFTIGRALKGQIDNQKGTIFGASQNFDIRISSANQAFHFYNFQLQSYRKAVDTWTIVGLGNKIIKDIRKMIGKMIWDARDEAKYF
jgi:hypothetical protein